jgi:hypothetical protein
MGSRGPGTSLMKPRFGACDPERGPGPLRSHFVGRSTTSHSFRLHSAASALFRMPAFSRPLTTPSAHAAFNCRFAARCAFHIPDVLKGSSQGLLNFRLHVSWNCDLGEPYHSKVWLLALERETGLFRTSVCTRISSA